MLISLIRLSLPGPRSDVYHKHLVFWQSDVIYSSSRVLSSLSCCSFRLSGDARLLHSADSFYLQVSVQGPQLQPFLLPLGK